MRLAGPNLDCAVRSILLRSYVCVCSQRLKNLESVLAASGSKRSGESPSSVSKQKNIHTYIVVEVVDAPPLSRYKSTVAAVYSVG